MCIKEVHRMAFWNEILTETERQVIVQSGYGQKGGFGERPALLVIDATHAFVGVDAPVLSSIVHHPSSIGEQAWRAVDQIQQLLAVCRNASVPVVYTVPSGLLSTVQRGKRSPSSARARTPDSTRIVQRVVPLASELVLRKPSASAFFGTPLASVLVRDRIDTVIVTGFVTSGCVRATVVDGCAHGYRVAVVEECVADRLDVSHKISLLDMHLKYADVVSMSEILDYLRDRS
jgi:nicotinamidase-related amidase